MIDTHYKGLVGYISSQARRCHNSKRLIICIEISVYKTWWLRASLMIISPKHRSVRGLAHLEGQASREGASRTTEASVSGPARPLPPALRS